MLIDNANSTEAAPLEPVQKANSPEPAAEGTAEQTTQQSPHDSYVEAKVDKYGLSKDATSTAYNPDTPQPEEVPQGVTGTNGTTTSGGTAASNPAGDVPQSWNNTCGANAVMAMESAVDSERGDDIAGMSDQERAELEGGILMSSGSFGVSNVTERPGGDTSGWGEWEMRKQISDRFVGEAQVTRPADRGDAVDFMVETLEEERPVAIGLPGHWLSATDIREGESGNELLIHDSWTGDSAWVAEDAIREGGNEWMEESFPGAPFEGRIATLVAPETAQLASESEFRANEAAGMDDMGDRYEQVYGG